MRLGRATIDDFLRADERTTVCRLTQLLGQYGQSGLYRLAQLARFERLIVENVENFKKLESWYLPWYKPNSLDEDGWEHAGTKNYTVAEYADYVRQGNIRPKDKERVTKINELKKKLKGSLCKDVVLVAAFDTKLNKRVIVDGCTRAVALDLIAKENHAEFLKLLSSKYQVDVIQLSSLWAHCLYPCDFTPFLEKDNPNSTRTELRDMAINELKTELESHCQ